MPYVSGFDRNQLMRCSWDAFVDEESMPENQVFGQSVGGVMPMKNRLWDTMFAFVRLS